MQLSSHKDRCFYLENTMIWQKNTEKFAFCVAFGVCKVIKMKKKLSVFFDEKRYELLKFL